MSEGPEILVKGLSSGYEVEHLARVFYPGAAPHAGRGTRGPLLYARANAHRLVAGLRPAAGRPDGAIHTAPEASEAHRSTPKPILRFAPPPADGNLKQALCRLLYDLLVQHTGLRPPWGLLTGVRPVNHLRKRRAQLGVEGARRYFIKQCDVSPQKLELAERILEVQAPVLASSAPRSYSLYVSIPFCPTRCDYCSFVSRTIEREGHLTGPYLNALRLELAETARVAAECGLRLETVYIGGGTPTALSLPELERLLAMVEDLFAASATREFTVEAGRPDCTGADKLALLHSRGVSRISINPQTMQDPVLRAIGRRHTAEEAAACYADARHAGFTNINMDLIAGLPGDDAAGFADTLDKIVALAPENITLHTLTLKRASNLVVEQRAGTSSPGAMVAAAGGRFAQAGYHPYYLYRQKSGVENLENTGWCRPGAESLYNIFIMEEAHTILAAGAGAATKLVLHGGASIRRRYNPKFPADYIQNIQQVIDKKRGVSDDYAGNLDTETTG